MINLKQLAGAMAGVLLACAGMPAFGAESANPAGPVPPQLFDVLANGNPVDALVLKKLKAEGIPPSELCTDEVFVRRVFLDTIGTLPMPPEVRAFLADQAPDKRARLIDGLLARNEFADYLGLHWGDLLRVKSEFPSNLWPNAVQAYDRWIRDSFLANKPYDQFVRELLTSSGSNFRSPPANFYRAFQERSPQRITENVALVFMGLRLDGKLGLSEAQVLGLSAFFAKIGYKNTDEWKEEIVFFNPGGKLVDPKTQAPVVPAVPAGRPPCLTADADPRIAFADWLTSPENPWFARCMANRVWYWLLGRGIVHEPDDMRPANQPWSPALLAYLEKEFSRHKYDLKHLYRLILNSKTYQLSSKPNPWNAADTAGFSHYRIRRLDAEVLLDAINQVLGTGEKYSSEIPEPFTFLPFDQRAIALADGSIESGFLELFGRPPRNSSFESERTAVPSVFQAQHLLNASHIQKKIEQSVVIRQLATGQKVEKPKQAVNNGAVPGKGQNGGKGKGKGGKNAEELVPGGVKKPLVLTAAEESPRLVEMLYLRILSRFPTAAEKRVAEGYLKSSKRKSAESVFDLVWVLLNSKEFLLKH